MDTKEFMQGDKWLGHPLHPALVAIPIGAWVFSLIMDSIAVSTGNKCAQEAADASLNLGLVGAGVSAVAGLTEFLRVPDEKEVMDTATNHGMCNLAITSTYAVNAVIRAARRNQGKSAGFLPRLMSAVCAASIVYSGWLGGNMVFNKGVGMHKAPETQKQLQFGDKQEREEAVRAHV